MELETTYVDVPIGDATMRTLVAAPANENQYPGIVFYSDIFQLTPSTTRWVKRLASYGFVVAAPEIYYRIEPAGTVLEFDDEG
jgi:carboxymethylenebutenolidase